MTPNESSKDSEDNKSNGKCCCMDSNAPCPIHPGSNHKWGKCRANAYNKEKSSKRRKEEVSPTTIKGQPINGIHGTKQLNQEILLEHISFPEFSPTQRFPGPIRATMFNNPTSAYDIILERDAMQALGINIGCSTKTISWNWIKIPFKPANYFSDASYDMSFAAEDDPWEENEATKAGYKSTKILHSKYEKISPEEVADQQKHLTKEQRKQLAELLSRYNNLFSGKLGKNPH